MIPIALSTHEVSGCPRRQFPFPGLDQLLQCDVIILSVVLDGEFLLEGRVRLQHEDDQGEKHEGHRYQAEDLRGVRVWEFGMRACACVSGVSVRLCCEES